MIIIHYITRNAILAVLITASLLIAGCGDEESAPAAWPNPACFRGGETPQLDLGGPVANWTWNDPHVIKVGDEYWMYASATDNFVFPVMLYRLVSTDGITWTLNPATPVLADVDEPAWDAGGLETPAVVYFNGQYHLFYTGYQYEVGSAGYLANSPGDFRVGHAVSNDGATFTRAAINPIVAPSGTADTDPSNDWYAFIVGEPGPVVYNGEIYLYFTTVGADMEVMDSLQVIGLVRSSDGASWQAPELALKPDQSIYPRTADWVGYSTPNAVVLDDGVHLFFDVAHQPDGGSWLQLRLHHARSADGKTGWTHDSSTIRKAGDFDWAIDEIRSPHAFLDGDVLKLYFAGHELNGTLPEHFAVGMMTCAK